MTMERATTQEHARVAQAFLDQTAVNAHLDTTDTQTASTAKHLPPATATGHATPMDPATAIAASMGKVAINAPKDS